MSEYRNSKNELFWTDDCANAVAAINFALDRLNDHYDRLDFLVSWRDGDVKDWPEFFDAVAAKPVAEASS